MKEIKLTIDGKEIQLTDEQLKMLRIEPEKKNPFDRVGNGDRFFAIDNVNGIQTCMEMSCARDKAYYNGINYFNDKKLAKQVALHQLLYRKLLKYSYDNECTDKEWDGTNVHVYIIYSSMKKDYDIRWTRDEKEPGTVYFKSTTWATAALNEVVMPFIKEHPDFVW